MRGLIGFMAALLLTAVSASATTYLVRPNGTGDFPTIQDAVNAAGQGDIIELDDGTFTGNRNRDIVLGAIAPDLIIRSRSRDPENCIIDCQGTPTAPHRGFDMQGTLEGAERLPTLEGITITNGYIDGDGGAVFVWFRITPTIRNCVFSSNFASDHGGGICHVGPFGTMSVVDCLFAENEAGESGGGVFYYSPPSGSALLLEGCTFSGNQAPFGGGATIYHVTVRNCTFYNNIADTGSGIFLHVSSSNASSIANTIVAFNAGGSGIDCSDVSVATISCTDVYGNAGGDWSDCIGAQYGTNGNIREDPLFCDPTHGDFGLQSGSPCAPFSPPNEECDLIGAQPVSCSQQAGCWPSLLSYPTLAGVGRDQTWISLGLGLYLPYHATVTVHQYQTGCLAFPPTQWGLPGAGCQEIPVGFEMNLSDPSCSPKQDLEIRASVGGSWPYWTETQTVLADYSTLGLSDLSPSGWGNFSGLDDLLTAFAPVLVLHPEDPYGPIDVDVTLHDADLRRDGYPPFTFAHLSKTDIAQYSWRECYIDLPCNGPSSCLQSYETAMAAHPDAYVVYATAIRDWYADGRRSADDIIVLQYWFNYYYNDWQLYFCNGEGTRGFFDHEGDWEHISVALTRGLEPLAVAFAAHDTPPLEVPWGTVQKVSGTHPRVYVARGSHASYPYAGSWPLYRLSDGLWVCDDATGGGDVYVPGGLSGGNETYAVGRLPRWANLAEMGFDAKWVKYSGSWGADASPVGPAFHDSWFNAGGRDFQYQTFLASCPVDLIVHGPDGSVTAPDSTGIPGSSYEVEEIDSLGLRNVRVVIQYPRPGEYQVEVVPTEGAPPEATYSLWSIRQGLGAEPDTTMLAQGAPVYEAPPEGYRVIPDIPFVGESTLSPDSWDLGWSESDTTAVEWHLSSPDSSFDVLDLVPESLRLNGSVPPILPVEAEDVFLRVRFPRGPAVHSIENPEAGTFRQVCMTGVFADSIYRLEATALVGLIESPSAVRPGADGQPAKLTMQVRSGNSSNSDMSILLGLPSEGDLEVGVLDPSGRAIRTLEKSHRKAGFTELTWDRRTSAGSRVPSGVYFIRARLGSKNVTERVVVVR